MQESPTIESIATTSPGAQAGVAAALPSRLPTLEGEAEYAHTLRLRDGELHLYRLRPTSGVPYLINLSMAQEMHAEYLRR